MTQAQAVPTIERRPVDPPMLVIDNPEYEAGMPGSIAYVKVERSMRNDPLGRLHAAGRLSRNPRDKSDKGDCEYRAGRMMQALLEAAEVRGPRSVDLTQDPVDSGRRLPQIMTDRQLKAIKRLNGIYPILGLVGKWLVLAVLSNGMMPEDYARAIGHADPREINSIGREFRRHLEVLAVEFGLARRTGT